MPALTGRHGGHDTNLREYAAAGMRLAGRLAEADGERIGFAGDLDDNLCRADRFFDERFRRPIDTYIERAELDLPAADDVAVTHQPAELTELDLASAGVSTVIWATGYELDYSWIAAPILDDLRLPAKRPRSLGRARPLLPRAALAALAGLGVAARPHARRPVPAGRDDPRRSAPRQELRGRPPCARVHGLATLYRWPGVGNGTIVERLGGCASPDSAAPSRTGECAARPPWHPSRSPRSPSAQWRSAELAIGPRLSST